MLQYLNIHRHLGKEKWTLHTNKERHHHQQRLIPIFFLVGAHRQGYPPVPRLLLILTCLCSVKGSDLSLPCYFSSSAQHPPAPPPHPTPLHYTVFKNDSQGPYYGLTHPISISLCHSVIQCEVGCICSSPLQPPPAPFSFSYLLFLITGSHFASLR